ncbi:MAG: dimethylglycine catabolism [Pyrinomonadaceae bacterium]|jgi:2,4-dienoyl-CoA reductase-like NADH-dependent reductase (Old Yellow Enzyme family)|nr:dimethylglycine catabolism [Pyrinomonadaceae bacterium]
MWKFKNPIRHAIPATRWPTAAEAAQSLLFQPIKIGPIEAASRTWVPAMVPWRATAEGFVTQENLDWYRRFAEGRPGVLVVEATGVRDIPSGPLLRIGHDRFLPGLRQLVETVRKASDGQTKLLIQIIDFLSVKRRPERQKYFERFLSLTESHRNLLAEVTDDHSWLSADETTVRKFLTVATEEVVEKVLDQRELESLRFGYREHVTDMHLPQVRELPAVLPDIFASAARRAREAGFDGVELHYAHAYTMAGFLSALNNRFDGYGGTRENRIRLPLEVYTSVRHAVGHDYVVGTRFLGDEVIAGGSHLNDAIYFGVEFARAGMDYLSLSKGGKFEDAQQPKVGHAVYPYTGQSGYECMPTILSDQLGPFGRSVPLVAAVKRAVNAAGFKTPIVAAGGITTFAQAEAILTEGQADIAGLARQALADPDWFIKVKLGRGDEIRRCNYTNYCEALDQAHRPVTCKLWDRTELAEPGAVTVDAGRRRLLAPQWQRQSDEEERLSVRRKAR